MTGTPEQIGRALRLYRVYSHKPFYTETAVEIDSEEDEEEYLVDHSIAIYLLNPKNEFLEYYPRRIEHQDIVEKIENYIHELKVTESQSTQDQ